MTKIVRNGVVSAQRVIHNLLGAFIVRENKLRQLSLTHTHGNHLYAQCVCVCVPLALCLCVRPCMSSVYVCVSLGIGVYLCVYLWSCAGTCTDVCIFDCVCACVVYIRDFDGMFQQVFSFLTPT